MSYSSWSPLARVYNPLRVGSIDGTDELPHDNGVVRAINKTYKPNKAVKGDSDLTIFVGRLNPDTTEEALTQAFSEYGSIQDVRLVRDIVTGFSKRYAFIEYTKEVDAHRAYRNGHKMVIDSHEILVDYEHERNLKGWKPRRFGGGFGGKKEAGQLRFGGRDRPFKKPIVVGKLNMRNEAESSRYSGWNRDDRRDDDRSRNTGRYFDRDRDSNRGPESSRISERKRDSERSRYSDRNRDSERSRNRDRSRSRSSRRESTYRNEKKSRDRDRSRSRSRNR